MKYAILVLFVGSLFGQTLPEAPRPQPSTCGPKWAGGCFVAPQKSARETIKDPYFLYPTILQWMVVGADTGITIANVNRSRGCFERNKDLGPSPSIGRIVGVNLAVDGTVTFLRFLAAKTVPDHDLTKVQKVARWISPGLAAISVYRHGHGVQQWVASGCL